MRFHHSTRRGRLNRLGGAGGGSGQQSSASRLGQAHSLTSRWAQLTYCRQTNIHFNRRLPVEPPASLAAAAASAPDSPALLDDSNLLLLIESATAPDTDNFTPSGATSFEPTYAASLSSNNNDEQWSASSSSANNEEATTTTTTTTPTTIRDQQQQQQPSTDDGQTLNGGAPAADSFKQQQQIDARLDRLNLNDSRSKEEANNNNNNNKELTMQILAKKELVGGQANHKSSATTPTQNLDSSKQRQRHLSSPKQHQQNNLVKLASKQQRVEVNNNSGNNQHSKNKLDMEFVREKLIAQVEKHPFWSNKAAKRMTLTSLDERRVFVYQLVSYCERRDLEWRYEPYRGGLVAGSTPFRRFEQQQHRQLLGSSVSQPTTPTTISPTDDWPPRRGGRNTPASGSQTSSTLTPTLVAAAGQRPFSYRPLSQATLQVPQSATPPSNTTSADLQQQQQFIFADSTTRSGGGANNKSPIRRSCSSAAASPMHHPIQDTRQQQHHLRRRTNFTENSIESPASTANQHLLFTHQQTVSSTATAATTTSQLPLSQQQCQTPSAELVWSIEPPLRLKPAPFVGYLHSTELPNSSFVKQCHGCQGRGRLKCTSCHGVGYEVCISCSGKGTLRGVSSAALHSHPAAGSSSSSAYRSGKQGGGGGGGIDNCCQNQSTFGSMWDSAADSGSSSGRRDGEPGGITQAGSSSGWTSESCHFCHGAGQKRCWICAGRAYNSCLACAGTGQLRCYLNLNITWLNHRDEHILNNSDSIIPKERLRLSPGQLILDESSERLRPVDGIGPLAGGGGVHRAPPTGGATCHPAKTLLDEHHDDEALLKQQANNQRPTRKHHNATTTKSDNTAVASSGKQHLVSSDEANQLRLISSRLLEKHTTTYRQERLLRQRHKVTQIECYVVNWEWKRRRGHFVIYGDDRKVYIAKYPFKSICNIT